MSKRSSSAATIRSVSREEPAGRPAKLVALVSGTSSGIGNACAIALLRSGYGVFGADIAPSPENLDEEPGYYHHHADLSTPEGVDEWVGAARSHSNRVDALVNCAGVHPPPRLMDDCTESTLAELWSANVFSAFWASKKCLPLLRQTRGAIVTISSLVAQIGQEAAVEYCLTKGALDGMTRALAIDEANNGVRVNAVCPGAIRTPLASRLNTEAELRTAARWCWSTRLGTPDEVAEVVLFLVSGATFVTGQTISVSGGAELGYGVKGPAI
jgi:L-fucose dehydrogenase